MAPRRSKHSPIPNKRARASTFRRRLESLYKKANELSILCSLEMCIVLLNPKDEAASIMWPSRDKAAESIARFLTFSEQERARKMVLQEQLLAEKLQEMTERLSRLREKNDEIEIGILAARVIDGGKLVNELDPDQLNAMTRFVGAKLERLQRRRDELNEMRMNRERNESIVG